MLTHNSKQRYLFALYKLATDDTIDMAMRYEIVREMQRSKEQANITKEQARRWKRIRKVKV